MPSGAVTVKVPLAERYAAVGLLEQNEALVHASVISSPIAVGSVEVPEACHVTSVADITPRTSMNAVTSIKRKFFIILLVFDMLMLLIIIGRKGKQNNINKV